MLLWAKVLSLPVHLQCVCACSGVCVAQSVCVGVAHQAPSVVASVVLLSLLLLLALQVKKKMSAEDFLKNNRGINDGQDLPADFMRSLYDRIVSNEIKVGMLGTAFSGMPVPQLLTGGG